MKKYIQKKYLLLICILLLQLFFLINMRFTAWPEMLSYAYLKNHGFLLYKDMIHPYPPILTFVLSILFNIFGYKIIVLKLLVWSLALFNTLTIYLISRKLTKNKWAIFVCFVYALLQPFLEGNMLWFDFVITTPLLLGFLFLIYWIKQKKRVLLLVSASLLFTVAGLTKQTGGLFFIAFMFWLILTRQHIKHILTATISPLILFIPFLIRLLQEEAIQGFLNWVILFPSQYWTKFPNYVQMDLTTSQIMLLIILVIPALISLAKWHKLHDKKIISLLLLFVVVGLFSVYPRFSYFHLQTVLPFLVIFIALFLSNMQSKIKYIFIILSSIFMANYIITPVLRVEFRRPTRFFETSDVSLAQKIAKLALPNERIFLLGIHPATYVYSNRLPTSPWGDNFGWYYELPNISENTLSLWANDPPKHIFWREANKGNKYDLGVYEPRLITSWIESNYEKLSEIEPRIWHWRLKE